MNEKFQNKFRNESARAQWWNYQWDGAYFITICTHNREHYFGKIESGKMNLSPIGVIADILWYEIKNRAKNIELGEFVIMPNHIHGILILSGNNVENLKSEKTVLTDDNCNSNNNNIFTETNFVGTGHALSTK